MEEKTTNFFAIPVFSFVPTKYKELVKNSAGKIFGAIFVTFLILGLIVAFKVNSTINQVVDVIEESCPNFELSNGEFSIDQPFNFDQDGTYLVIDDSITNITEDSIKDLIVENLYSQIIILGKDSFGMYNNGQIQCYNLSDINLSFSKTSLIDQFIPTMKPIVLGCVVIFYLIYVGFYYLAAWIMSLITNLICKIMKKDIDEKERFRITVLAKLPVFIISVILGLFTPLSIGIWLGALLVIIYVVVIVKLYSDEPDYYNIEENNYSSDYTE